MTAALEWIAGVDTGISSKAIWARMQGVRSGDRWWNYPRDPDDLGRCLRLLAVMPLWRIRLGEMAAEGPEWAALVGAWDELEVLWNAEGDGTTQPPFGTRMPKLYERMRELIDGAQKATA